MKKPLTQKKHKHETFSIITNYFMDKPAKVVEARCSDCGEHNERLLRFMQEREDATWKLYGEKSPYVIVNGGIDSVSERALVDAKDPRIKDLI